MRIEFTPEQQALQDELRAYFGGLMTPERRAELGNVGDEVGEGPVHKEIIRQMGRDGWLGIGWPKEYGGQGRGPVEQLIFLEEAARAGAPIPLVTLNTVGPTLAEYGTEEQKERFLPLILTGEVTIAIGYTEPGAGTDLASLRTKAVRDGDEYVVNGQKIFTSDGDIADFIWLACRTDADAPKHKGISILLVDTTLPGFKSTPIWTVAGGHTNSTYYEDVRVPVSMRVGEEHGGWKMITTQLNFERVALGPAARIIRALDSVIAWAKETTTPDGVRYADLEWVRINLARVRAKTEACDLFNWRIASLQEHGQLNPADASALKVYGTELRIEALRLLMEILGPAATLKRDSPGAVLAGQLEMEYRGAIIGTFGGGVNEVQREIVASVGLGTPRVPR
ncbi:MAG: 3-oxocholest-4-en-26-oyl-CoA dehydrogenase alpha subunit [Actinomycetota bacterium]|jgi:alkylation response protein AidB-like acyl-CoA dehydrogenase